MIVATIEARMTSSRLPGKVLMPCQGKPMLELLVERVRRSKLIDRIVVSTTVNKQDDAIVECAKKIGIGYFRGSELDVVDRVVRSMRAHEAETVVQLTGDCPLLDATVIDQLIRLYQFNAFDYVSNNLVRSYPRGLDCQVASFKTLDTSLEIAKDEPQHEHVFLSIYENPQRFKLFNLVAPPELCRPDMRWTLDTPADFEFIKRIYDELYPSNPAFTSMDIVRYLEKNPEILKINADVVQKAVRS